MRLATRIDLLALTTAIAVCFTVVTSLSSAAEEEVIPTTSTTIESNEMMGDSITNDDPWDLLRPEPYRY